MAMRKPKREEREDDGDAWLVTYADAITLLLAFFVLTTAISRIELPTFEEAQGAIAQELGTREVKTPIAKLEDAVDAALSELAIGSESRVARDHTGLVIEIDSGQIFRPGVANLRSEVDDQLSDVFREIASASFSNFLVEIQSYAEVNGNPGPFPGLWDLTAARSAMLARYIVWKTDQFGQPIAPDRVRAVFFGDSRVRGAEDWQVVQKLADRGKDLIAETSNISNERTVFRFIPMDPKVLEARRKIQGGPAQQ